MVLPRRFKELTSALGTSRSPKWTTLNPTQLPPTYDQQTKKTPITRTKLLNCAIFRFKKMRRARKNAYVAALQSASWSFQRSTLILDTALFSMPSYLVLNSLQDVSHFSRNVRASLEPLQALPGVQKLIPAHMGAYRRCIHGQEERERCTHQGEKSRKGHI